MRSPAPWPVAAGRRVPARHGGRCISAVARPRGAAAGPVSGPIFMIDFPHITDLVHPNAHKSPKGVHQIGDRSWTGPEARLMVWPGGLVGRFVCGERGAGRAGSAGGNRVPPAVTGAEGTGRRLAAVRVLTWFRYRKRSVPPS